MATDLNGPAEIVQDAYDRSVQLANTAVNSLQGFTTAMENTFQTAPTINVQWATIPAPSIEALPDMPTMPEIVFNAPLPLPAALDATLPDIGDIQDFDVVMPEMDFGTAPTVNIGQVPSIPGIGAVSIPAAPSIVLPSVPEYLTLSTPMFAGIDLHGDYLQKLQDMPELVLAMPTPLNFSRGPHYASQLLDNLKAALNERLRGGTGLNSAVEQALWERGRDRESQIWLTQEADIARSSESMGFALPPGVLNAQLSRARKDYFSKLSGLSRDISIKQAELEQSNLQQTITQGLQLENQLMDYAIRVEQMAFEMAKAAAESALQIYNAGLDHFKVLVLNESEIKVVSVAR